MSLKENIEMVKDELNSEEKFFESAVKTENFVKKYRSKLIAGVVLVVVLLGAKATYDVMQSNKIDEINSIFTKLQTSATPALTEELKALQPELYSAWKLSQAIVSANISQLQQLQNSKQNLISDVSSYQAASLLKDEKALNAYSLKQDAIYKDEALLQSAILLFDKKEFDKAHQKLQLISKESALAPVATLLLHYGVK
ncbi:MAG: hypothetical protein U9N42_04255 [Campylobacterota bacterium]|nr:hypothetical protein [Campylobacterota bacterium]